MTTTSPKIAARAAVLYTLHMLKQLSYSTVQYTQSSGQKYQVYDRLNDFKYFKLRWRLIL